MYLPDQRGFAPILVIALLLVGITSGLVLVQNPQILKSRAQSPAESGGDFMSQLNEISQSFVKEEQAQINNDLKPTAENEKALQQARDDYANAGKAATDKFGKNSSFSTSDEKSEALYLQKNGVTATIPVGGAAAEGAGKVVLRLDNNGKPITCGSDALTLNECQNTIKRLDKDCAGGKGDAEACGQYAFLCGSTQAECEKIKNGTATVNVGPMNTPLSPRVQITADIAKKISDCVIGGGGSQAECEAKNGIKPDGSSINPAASSAQTNLGPQIGANKSTAQMNAIMGCLMLSGKNCY